MICRWAQRAQWQRALQRRQPVEVAATYPRGIQASLRVHRDPVHSVFPHRRQVRVAEMNIFSAQAARRQSLRDPVTPRSADRWYFVWRLVYQRNVAASHSEPPMAAPATPRRCSKPFKHPGQEHEVGLAASWLSRLGDGVTADLETSSRAGQFASVTAATALDSQRHAIGKLTHIETHHGAIRNTEVKGPTCAWRRSSCGANASGRTPGSSSCCWADSPYI